ncbi:homoserine dehydrogenase [Trichothermofontia sichuanensis B231]|uniref:homoserine dehydrogenase n=1 Tax=Trichothermofontia sichuanensis TaxID=3045816 RepID=UPI002247F455|nr:homoserine dehydrogenase [Trichothermofontia sichuanensis]UZQ53950.1 homoserine dehydrogenase [Trichothermofontia sichuanensis B231]
MAIAAGVLKIGLLGLGTVGSGTADILLHADRRHPLLQRLTIHRVGVRSLDKPRPVDLPASILTTDLESIVTDPDIDIVVEVIGGLEPARSLILKAIAHGKHVVTANKAVIARYGDEIFTAAEKAGVYVLEEAAVGGGIPVIQPLKQALSVNRIRTITGIVNGTTNYILTRMRSEGADFAEVLADAQRLGYAEADPTADVDGLDAADKITILASLAFGKRIKLEEVYCEGIRQISAADIAYAERLGFVIKLLAIAEQAWEQSGADGQPPRLSVRVHPTLLPQSHPLASVNEVYNAVLIEGEPIGQVMLYGPGAGSGPTASAVVSDILNIAALLGITSASQAPLHPLLAPSHQQSCRVSTIADLKTRFYARVLTQDQPGVIGKLGTCFGNHGVSLESVVQIDLRQGKAEIVVVTHNVLERNFRQALAELETLDVVAQIPSVLRVLADSL